MHSVTQRQVIDRRNPRGFTMSGSLEGVPELQGQRRMPSGAGSGAPRS